MKNKDRVKEIENNAASPVVADMARRLREAIES